VIGSLHTSHLRKEKYLLTVKQSLSKIIKKPDKLVGLNSYEVKYVAS